MVFDHNTCLYIYSQINNAVNNTAKLKTANINVIQYVLVSSVATLDVNNSYNTIKFYDEIIYRNDNVLVRCHANANNTINYFISIYFVLFKLYRL